MFYFIFFDMLFYMDRMQYCQAYIGKSLNVDDAMISGYEYLEKIIQLPFCLPEPPPEKIKTFIANSIRPYEVNILHVARRLKIFLKCIKSFIDDYKDLKS
jgi:hypothetical protein